MSRRIATANNYAELQQALRQRKEELHLSNEVLSEIAGMPDGLVNKLLSPNVPKNIGITSLGLLLQALGLRLLVVEDRAQLRQLRDRLTPRNEAQVRHRTKRKTDEGAAHV